MRQKGNGVGFELQKASVTLGINTQKVQRSNTFK